MLAGREAAVEFFSKPDDVLEAAEIVGAKNRGNLIDPGSMIAVGVFGVGAVQRQPQGDGLRRIAGRVGLAEEVRVGNESLHKSREEPHALGRIGDCINQRRIVMESARQNTGRELDLTLAESYHFWSLRRPHPEFSWCGTRASVISARRWCA